MYTVLKSINERFKPAKDLNLNTRFVCLRGSFWIDQTQNQAANSKQLSRHILKMIEKQKPTLLFLQTFRPFRSLVRQKPQMRAKNSPWETL